MHVGIRMGLVLGAGLLGLGTWVSCGSTTRTSTPGTIPEFEEGDVEIMVDGVTDFTSMNDLFMGFVPGGATPEMEEDECVTIDPPDPQLDENGGFDFTVFFEDCALGDRESALEITGEIEMNGESDPDALDVAAIITECAPFIDDLESKVLEQGSASLLFEVDADYGLQQNGSELQSMEADVSVLSYSGALLYAGTLVFPFESQDERQYVANVSQHLYFDLANTGDESGPFGTVEIIIRRPGSNTNITRVDFTFDGTNIASFDVQITGRSGTVNLTTNDVNFDE